MAAGPVFVGVTSTLAMVRTAETRGVLTADLLEQAGIGRETLEDPDARVPGAKVLGIWNALRERTADPALQLAAPVSLPFGAYRVIDYLVAASSTVGDGIRRFASFFGLIASGVTLDIHHDENGHCITLVTKDGDPLPPVYVDYVFAALVGRLRMRVRPTLEVSRVELCQLRPSAPEPYLELFGASVHFGAAADRLWFSDREWAAPMETADEALADLLEEHARILAQRIPRSVSGFGAEVQKALASVLPDGGSAADVARALHMSVRTLQRKLVRNGTTFREVSDTVKSHLAREYLSDRAVSIAEVALLLGFSDQSSFNRAFRRWTGETPGRWRRHERRRDPRPR